ncbi:MAG: carboxypeptidase-like regulatory domain-containing protein [Actinomycetota bacterium]|nr:carboxypeptidase-like regulatory domain-containing protein [Actinomycetota bacterium]
MKKHLVAIVVAAAVAAFGLPASVSAVALHSISGTVRDVRGRPLEGVTVKDDQGRSNTTSAEGRYALSVSTGTYTVTASKSGLDTGRATVTVNATPLTTVQDFTLYYSATTAPTPQAVTTASSEATIDVMITTGALPPGSPGEAGTSCVKVHDSRTGTTTEAWFDRTSDRIAYWRAEVTAPRGSTEGTFRLTPKVVDCASGATLSSPTNPGTQYTVDNTAPTIPLEALVPADGTNTVHGAGQPLLATVKDALSGVLNTSITFELFDQDGTKVFTSGTTSSTRPTFNSITGQAATPPVANLQNGRLYFVRVTAKDKAGNRAVQSHTSGKLGGGFLATTASPQGTTASVPGSSCTVAAEVVTTGKYAGTKRVTCPSVTARLDATSIGLGGVRHADFGYVSQTFGLDSATVAGTIGGVPSTWAAFQADDPAWRPRTKSMPYWTGTSSSWAFTAEVPAAEFGLGALVTYVPATFDSGAATLRMNGASAVATTSSCAAPQGSTAKVPCSPDPLDARFIVTLRAGVDPAAVADGHASRLAVVVRERRGREYSAFVPPESLQALAGDADVVGVRRETVSSELYPDDWEDTIGDVDTGAVVTEAETRFGSRYGGSWIDRSVMPSVWRVAVKDATPDDYAALAAVTTASDRFVLHEAAYSQADFDAAIATAQGVLQSHGVEAIGFVRDIPRQRLEIEVSTVTDTTRDALIAALPAGMPLIATGRSPGMANHLNRYTGVPVEGGLSVTSTKPTGEFNGACTTSFAVKRSAVGALQWGGVSAGHCMEGGDTATAAETSTDGMNSGVRNFGVAWSGWYTHPDDQQIDSDGAIFMLGQQNQATKDVLVFSNVHHRIKGRKKNAELTYGMHTCFQGVSSANATGSGTFDNCGPLGSQIVFQKVTTSDGNRVLKRSWCFGPATANPGDSGGPVYKSKKPDLWIMGIHSYSKEYPKIDPEGLTHPTAGASGASTDPEAEVNRKYACFSSIEDFETASGWTLHY